MGGEVFGVRDAVQTLDMGRRARYVTAQDKEGSVRGVA